MRLCARAGGGWRKRAQIPMLRMARPLPPIKAGAAVEPQLFQSQSDPNGPIQLLNRTCVDLEIAGQRLICFSI